MPPNEPKRALVVGAITAAPLTVVSGLLFAIGGAAEAYALWLVAAVPFVTALTTAQYLHAFHAILLASTFSIIAFALIAVSGGGPPFLAAVTAALPVLFGAAVIGAILGLLLRPLVRKMVGT
jgi:hypothetical protein